MPSGNYYGSRSMAAILAEVAIERDRQDRRWGGALHDDGHEMDDWAQYIKDHVEEALDADGSYDDAATRKALIQVAALAVAAVEALDRRVTIAAAEPQG